MGHCGNGSRNASVERWGLEPPATFRAAILKHANGPFEFGEVTLSPPRSDEVIVRLVATGICHAELAVRDRTLPAPLPIVLGHEGAGVVVEIGSAVTNVVPGDRVVLTFLTCGECRECRAGEIASCAHLGACCLSGARADGTHAICAADGETLNDRFFGQSSFASYALAHASSVVKVSDEAPLELLGPLGCGVMTGAGAIWNALRVSPGSSCAVYGAGAVGLSGVMAARVAEAATIIAVDPVPSRRDLALELGATHAIDSDAPDLVATVKALSAGGVDFALDATGKPGVLRTAVRSLGQRGVAAFVSAADRQDVVLDTVDLLAGCKTVMGVVEGGGSPHVMISRLIDLHLQGNFPFDRLVRFYRFDEINQAIEDCEHGRSIKPILRMTPQDGGTSTAIERRPGRPT